jgi:two-component system cell cycle sensor histidine kinase/response regulator CckA
MAESIVVIDDDADVRMVARLSLANGGFHVLETGDPQEVIQLTRAKPVHLLLTDVVMPLMSGLELADRVRALNASTRILLMSGYQTATIARSGLPLIAKLFSSAALVCRVREVLDRPSLFARPAASIGPATTQS